MSSENEKKGLFGRLLGTKKPEKSSCCGSFRIEAIPDDEADEKPNAGEKDKNEKGKDSSCCCQ